MITLHPWDDADWPAAWVWFKPFWDRVANDFSPKTLEDFMEMKRAESPITIARGVYRDRELGGVLSAIHLDPSLCQVHVFLKREFWGAETVIPAVCQGQQLLWSLGYKKLWCLAYADNHRVIGLLDRIGARYEGTLFKHTQRCGEMVDMVSYGIYRD